MALDARSVILVGSAALWVVLGAALFACGRRSVEARPLAVLFLASGALYLGNNYLTMSGIGMFSLIGATWWTIIGAVVTVAGVVLLRRWAGEDGRLARVPLLASGVILAAMLTPWTWNWGPYILSAGGGGVPPVFATQALFYGVMAPTFLVVAYASARAAVRPEPAAVRRTASISLGLGLLEIYAIFSFLPLPNPDPVADTLSVVIAACALAVVVVPWLVASERGAGKAAVLTPLAFCFTGLFALAGPLLTGFEAMAIGMSAVRGVVRTVAWAVIALGILRYDAVGLGLRPKMLERGTIATGALAALFIIAQIAQEFLAAEYGLLLGGVVAGSLLFAANPVLRTMERIAGHEASQPRTGPGPTLTGPGRNVAEQEASYREAVRLALRDRTLTREEERHLLRLAYHLGVSTPRALEIHDEVEQQLQEDAT